MDASLARSFITLIRKAGSHARLRERLRERETGGVKTPIINKDTGNLADTFIDALYVDESDVQLAAPLMKALATAL